MRNGPLGIPGIFARMGWPFRPPKQSEVDEIREYHVEELGMDPVTARRHISEEYLVVLDEFVPDDFGYRGKVAFAIPDQVENFTVYYWPEGEVEILSEGTT